MPLVIGRGISDCGTNLIDAMCEFATMLRREKTEGNIDILRDSTAQGYGYGYGDACNPMLRSHPKQWGGRYASAS